MSLRQISLSDLLTDAVREKAVLGKIEAMATHSLVRTKSTPIYTRTTKGTDAVASGTKAMYENRWDHFHSFCVLLGFYTCSLVLDRDGCPDSPIPVETDTIRMYIQYMTFSRGEVLSHPVTTLHVHDVMNNPVLCTGEWKAPVNLIKFRSSMLALDSLHAELTGPGYVAKCAACIALTASDDGTGYLPCPLHTEGARVRSRGCSINAPDVTHCLACSTNRLKDYVRKGNIQLLPSEVRRIRDALLVENDIFGLQYWTMVIMGIKLFLRISELLCIKIEDFDPSLMLLESTSCHVSALAVRIKGKGGKISWLSMYVDDEYPQLCPIRALLLYISLSGIKEGYIFPKFLPGYGTNVATNEESSTEPTGDENESTLHYPYSAFITRMKCLLTVIIGREKCPTDIFGTHILRKTAYLFAIFGLLRQHSAQVQNLHDLLMVGIMDSARHACIKNVRYYSQDASTRYEWDVAKRIRTEDEVPIWRSIHILNPNVTRAQTITSRNEQQDLWNISMVYLTKFLRFPVQVPVADAVARAFMKLPAATETSADLFLKERLTPLDYQDYLSRKSLDAGNNPPVGPSVPSVLPSTPGVRTYYNPQRSTLAKQSNSHRIHIYDSMYQEDKGRASGTFTPSYKTLFFQKVKPVARCLALCYQGDVATFSLGLGDFVLPNKGKYECCSFSKNCLSA
jgi:hypothetical protein